MQNTTLEKIKDLLKNIWRKIEHRWYNLIRGFRNIQIWFPVIWHDRDWDWSFLSTIIQAKLNNMARNAENWHHIDCERNVKQMRLCSELLRRNQEDNYFSNARKSMPDADAAKHSMQMSKQDLEYFGKIFGKYMNHWWD